MDYTMAINVKKALQSVRDNFNQKNPYEVKRKDAEEQNPLEKDRTFLIMINGENYRALPVKEEKDDRRLIFEEDNRSQECKVTSKPVTAKNTRLYFTRDGFKGTMALHKDTLLDADEYKPDNADPDEESEETGFEGDVELVGSKATLRTSNKAIRLRKLLQPQGMDRKTLLLAIGSGVAVGFVIYPQVMQ